MAEQAIYCPFLNRADRGCGEHFTLDRLDHAFAYCFDRYSACPNYVRLLAERQVRQMSAAGSVGADGADARIEPFAFRPVARRATPQRATPVVQVTVRRAEIDQFFRQPQQPSASR